MKLPLRTCNLPVEEMRQHILAGRTIKELQSIYGRSRTTIMDFKKQNGLVGITPNSKKLGIASGEKKCTGCDRILPLEQFFSNGYLPSGRRKFKSKCKDCSTLESAGNFHGHISTYLQSVDKKYACEECGASGPPGFLDFHHKDPSTKDFTISEVYRNIGVSRFEQLVVPELEKCMLLCPNCHRLKHINIVPGYEKSWQ